MNAISLRNGLCLIAGNLTWYKDGIIHREDGPAIIYTSGRKEWLQNGFLHREGGPAIESESGSKFWILNGKYHMFLLN